MGEERKDRTTDPAPPPSRETIFDDLMEKVADLHQANREMSKLILALAEKNTQFSEAILDIQSSLTALWADSTLVREQVQPIGVQLGEMDQRIVNLEKRIRDSQVPEAR